MGAQILCTPYLTLNNWRPTLKYLVAFLLIIAGTYASAHPGHDHSHWASDAIHLAVFALIPLTVALSVFFMRKNAKKVEVKS